MSVSEFRWKYTDDLRGTTWSDWHTAHLPCPTCCHSGPSNGRHNQIAGYYNEFDDLDTSYHTTCGPTLDDDLPIEWR